MCKETVGFYNFIIFDFLVTPDLANNITPLSFFSPKTGESIRQKEFERSGSHFLLIEFGARACQLGWTGPSWRGLGPAGKKK